MNIYRKPKLPSTATKEEREAASQWIRVSGKTPMQLVWLVVGCQYFQVGSYVSEDVVWHCHMLAKALVKIAASGE